MAIDTQKLLALARELAYAQPVLEPLKKAALALPEDLPIADLTRPETAEEAWGRIRSRISSPEEDHGMAHLAVMTLAALETRKEYARRGIPDRVFVDTMGCFGRFLREAFVIHGRWLFDRSFWTWRQVGCRLFRLGTLEFEYWKVKEGDRLPEGVSPGDPVLLVHVPSNAVLSREALDKSYRQAREFFFGPHDGPWLREVPRVMLCGSWLLCSTLDALLPRDSGIRRFASDFQIYYQVPQDNAYLRWVYKTDGPVPCEDLPENTGLQRALKAHLLAGGSMGQGVGVIRI